jgi:threonine dehydrogenase-like Zn-dependent dehydrogenase
MLSEQPQPQAREGEVLVRVAAVGVSTRDVDILDGRLLPPFVKYPIIPGHAWAGTVVEVGPDVNGLQVGQRVVGESYAFCTACFWCRRGETNLCATYNQLGSTVPGGCAEYVSIRADLAHPLAQSLSFETGALADPAAHVGHGFLRANVQPSDTVVIIGADTIGLLGAGWARLSKARYVVVIGIDRLNEDVAYAMGATHYLIMADDPVSFVRDLTAGEGADVVFEAAGSEVALPVAMEIARPGGTIALTGIAGGGRKAQIEPGIFRDKYLHIHGIYGYTSAVFVQTLRLIEAEAFNLHPLITHVLPLEDYAWAFELLRRRRKPVVTVLLKPQD